MRNPEFRSIHISARNTRNGFIGVFSRGRGFDDGGDEFVATNLPSLKRSVMAEFEARLDVGIAALRESGKTTGDSK